MTTATHPKRSYPDQLRRKAARMIEARKRGQPIWRHLVHVGVLGWMFVLPIVVSAFLGGLLARATGVRSLAVGSIILGVAVGGYVVWRQVSRSMRDDEEEESEP